MSVSSIKNNNSEENIVDSIDTNVICKSSKSLTNEQKFYNRKVALHKLKKAYEEQVTELKRKVKDKKKLKEAISEAKKEYKSKCNYHIPIKLSQQERDAGWQIAGQKSWKEICEIEYKRWKREDESDLMKYGMNYKKLRRKDPKSKFFAGRREEAEDTLE